MKCKNVPLPKHPWPLLMVLVGPLLVIPIGCGESVNSPESPALRPSDIPALTASKTPALQALAALSSVLEHIERGQLNEKLDNIDAQLELAEQHLGHVDSSLRSEVSVLRSELATKVDRGEVEEIVRDLVSRLDATIAPLEQRADTVNASIARLKELLGYVPTVTPTPLIIDTLSGEPAVHELTAAWAKLLVESEKNRTAIEMSLLTPAHPEMKRLKSDAKSILERTESLRHDIAKELGGHVDERNKLVKLYYPAHGTVKEVDQALAPLAWLAMVASIEHKSSPGRLGIPKVFVLDEASECVDALDRSGVRKEDVAELYRSLLTEIPRDPLYPTDAILDAAIERKTDAVVADLEKLYDEAIVIQERLEELEQIGGKRNVELMRTQSEQARILRQLSEQLPTIDDHFRQCLLLSCSKLLELRLSEGSMQQFLSTDLLPLREYSKRFLSPIAGHEPSDDQLWNALVVSPIREGRAVLHAEVPGSWGSYPATGQRYLGKHSAISQNVRFLASFTAEKSHSLTGNYLSDAGTVRVADLLTGELKSDSLSWERYRVSSPEVSVRPDGSVQVTTAGTSAFFNYDSGEFKFVDPVDISGWKSQQLATAANDELPPTVDLRAIRNEFGGANESNVRVRRDVAFIAFEDEKVAVVNVTNGRLLTTIDHFDVSSILFDSTRELIITVSGAKTCIWSFVDRPLGMTDQP